jgi:hypothetical protein
MCSKYALSWFECTALNVWHMFFLATNIHRRFELTRDETAGAFELRVAENVVDAEAAPSVYRVDGIEGVNEGCLLAIGKDGSSDEADVAGD